MHVNEREGTGLRGRSKGSLSQRGFCRQSPKQLRREMARPRDPTPRLKLPHAGLRVRRPAVKDMVQRRLAATRVPVKE